ncbi:uncharacterized protein LOC115770609 isoform X2 [Drosophila novamexicana]|uniref:uncharacterized protein LOC115770609 isoform X2 n=1 Tax=Drosophila novamexicana TaxID=47314 RepID=UPI0011E5FB90|nr:uncharacterized protein LOC115770609 isoform X2 [Drosophila novamexicana]
MKVPFEILLFVIVINVFTAERHRNRVKSRNSLDDHQGHNQLVQRKRLSEQHTFKRRNGRIQNEAALQNNQRSLWKWIVKTTKKVTKAEPHTTQASAHEKTTNNDNSQK